MNPTSEIPIRYDDTVVKWFLYPAFVFLNIGMIIGVFISFNGFLFPDYFSGQYITFGRIRPVHVGHVLFLWLLSANLGLFFYFVPRLCGVPLWSTKLGVIAAIFWWFGLVIGIYSYPFGTNFGWEYAELPNWVGFIPVKTFVTVAWVLAGANLFLTVFTRRYKKMYVSLWYAMGTMIWGTFTYIVGSWAINYVPGGISRVNVSWFYIHNLVGLIFTPMGLATAYYFLPKLSHLPIYSHRLSMIGFWSIAFTYAWIGAHHMIHGPISQWLQTVSIIFSIWLFIPVWTVVTNLFATLQGHWNKYSESAPIRFLMMGNIFYLITCIQGPLMGLRRVNEITSKTDWIIGHSHISLYATFTFFAFSGVYQALPVITGKPLWSNRLADWHFSLNLWGSVPFILPLWLGGFWQGMLWSTWGQGFSYLQMQGNLSKVTFLDTIAQMIPFWWLRSIGGIIILFANLLFLINAFNTIVLPVKEKKEVAYG